MRKNQPIRTPLDRRYIPQVFIGVFTILVGSGIIWIVRYLANDRPVDNGPPEIEIELKINILSPVNGEMVDRTTTVSGKTSVGSKNHYILVTSANGDKFVQNGPFPIPSSGDWTGMAAFGTGIVGAGEAYDVQVVATETELPGGRLRALPEGAVLSNSIRVTRREE